MLSDNLYCSSQRMVFFPVYINETVLVPLKTILSVIVKLHSV